MTGVSAGGKLVAIGSAINKLSGKDGFEIESKGTPEPDTSEKEPPVHPPLPYAGSDRRSMSDDIPGTIFQTKLDTTHPLCFGLGEAYWTMKATTSNYKWLEEGGNAIYLDDSPRYYGFAGYKALEKTKEHPHRRARANRRWISGLHFVDNPMLRSFWNSGKELFSNALFF